MTCNSSAVITTEKIATLNKDIDTQHEVITSNDDYTSPASDGEKKLTLAGLNKNYVNRVIGSFGDTGLKVTNGQQSVTDLINGGEWKPLSSSYPVNVPLINPLDSSWYQVSFNSHNQLGGRDAPEAHDTIYNRSFSSVDEMVSYQFHSIGLKYSTGGTVWEVGTIAIGRSLGGGLYAAPIGPIYITDYGADRSGVTLINNILNEALNSSSGSKNPIFFPKGNYRIENFKRTPQPPHNSVRQEVVCLVGEKSPATVAHQFQVAPSVLEGDGDLFLDVVNYSFTNLGIQNKLNSLFEPDVPGVLFTMLADGAEGGSWTDCYFGPCKNHFRHDETPTPDPTLNYMLNIRYNNCSFFHAQEHSRYFNGYTAGYREERCYTSHCTSGLFMTQPGPCARISGSTFEYIDDHAIELDLYGYASNYQIEVESTFFESCGGGQGNIPGVTPPVRAIAYPSIGLKSQVSVSAFCKFTWRNCHSTYTGAPNNPIAYVYLPDSNYVVTSDNNVFSYTPNNIYSASATTYVDPTPNNILFINNEGNKFNKQRLAGVLSLGGLAGESGAINTKNGLSAQLWLENIAGSDAYMSLICVGTSGRFGVDSSNGTYMQSGSTKVMSVTAAFGGRARLLQDGSGLEFRSPDGLTSKVLSINNSGSPVWS